MTARATCCLLGFLALAPALRAESFLPPAGKILYIAGQDRESIQDYFDAVCASGRECPLPAGVAFYTGLTFAGIKAPQANRPGDNHQDLAYLLTLPRSIALQVGLYLESPQLAAIGRGEFDSAISALAAVFRDCGRTVYLRIGYEFDGLHNAYDPPAYIAAYRRIADGFRAAGARNVAYVWHSWAEPKTYRGLAVMSWYPGDAYVDWLGISVFHKMARPQKRLIRIARARRLPVMICESSAVRRTARDRRRSGRAYWDFWYKPYFRLIEKNPEIRAFSIIHCNWDGQEQFRTLGWGDARINADPVVLRNWRTRLRDPRFLSAPGSGEAAK